jgi:ferritin-like metal-binding protein YciE
MERDAGAKMSEWADEYLTLLDDCEKREDRLTDWERTFVDSLRSWIEGGKRPTPKQIETLDNVWERATARG